MATEYRKPAPKRAKRTNRRHGELVKLAAQIAGRSVWTVYGVLHQRVKSERVQQAIDEAKARLRHSRRAA
jgi:hypothetical protein